MKYRNKIIMILLSFSMLSTIFVGCGDKNETSSDDANQENTEEVVSTEAEDLSKTTFENNNYYIRHSNGTYDKLYKNNQTFDDIAKQAEKSRIMWFEDKEFENVPTLFNGDSLVFYSEDEFEETFSYERFEYLGYTLGICNMTETESGRYKISTETDKKCTFPGSDADEILTLTNENVIIDKIAKTDLRQASKGEEAYSFLTQWGTLSGLQKNKTYAVDIFDGTLENDYALVANIVALGSMEVLTSHKFEFINGKLITLELPEWLKDGYYNVNNQGLFRYAPSYTQYNESDNYNLVNTPPEEELKSGNREEQEWKLWTFNSIYDDESSEFQEGDGFDDGIPDDAEVDDYGVVSQSTSFEVKKSGDIVINAELKTASDKTAQLPTNALAIVEDPDGFHIAMASEGDHFIVDIDSATVGVYKINFYNIGALVPDISIESVGRR